MPKWLRKSFVVMVTILTFGLVTPSQAFLYDHSSTVKTPKRDIIESSPEGTAQENRFAAEYEEQQGYTSKEDFVSEMVCKAEMLSYTKFGAKIKPMIADEFSEVILPNIEKAIKETAEQYPEEELAYLSLSEKPSGGLSEKIFHIANEKTGEDIIRFHVRRDHPPQEGYWFNFHYHTHHDEFQAHHNLGSIYWNKNTPPKWMS